MSMYSCQGHHPQHYLHLSNFKSESECSPLSSSSSVNPRNVTVPDTNPDYLTLWELERFDYDFWQGWFERHWTIGIYIVALYVILIFSLKAWMRNKEPYSLRAPLILWNLGLALFSVVGFSRMLPELVHLLQEEDGFHSSFCNSDRMNIATIYWTLVVTLSKVVELGDTIFILLRKQPLIFLHWWHHASVLLYGFISYHDHDSGHRWFVSVNLFIHSIMYSYFAIRAFGIKVPKNIAKGITSIQLLQMFVGLFISGYGLLAKWRGIECQTPTFNLTYSFLMYLSYAVLFGNFFVQSYLKKNRRKKHE